MMVCRICSVPIHWVFDLRSRRTQQDVAIYKCLGCNAYFSNGGQVDYRDLDLTGYYLPHAAKIRDRYDRLFTHLETQIVPGRFLDIGAGIGFSLDVAQQRGWSPKGLEPNRALAEYARLQGLDVENAYLTSEIAGEYDVVLIDNVLEHILDPLAFLRDASRLMAPDAVMVTAIPPVDWLRQALGAVAYVRNKVDKPQLNIFNEVDEHVNILGRRSMARLAQVAGLAMLPTRFHHSKIYDNAVFRAMGLDDGYYFLVRR